MKFKPIVCAALAVFAVTGANPACADSPPAIPQALIDAAKSLHPQHGRIALPGAHATLDLGDAYDFYGPEDADTILTRIWGNPPGSAKGVLGVVMKAGTSPLSDAWGAVVSYENTGYVSDDDAAAIDSAKLLEQMRDGEDQENEQRKQQGYPAIHLAGWAEPPSYEKENHAVIWARDLSFADSKTDTLNYDVRALGRGGVLSLNLVSQMPHLAEVRAAAHEFASHASFDPGARYADFDPNLDKKAEYGIGGLIAAGVGVAVAKKLGLLAILLKFIKPLIIALIASLGAFKKQIARLLGLGEDPDRE